MRAGAVPDTASYPAPWMAQAAAGFTVLLALLGVARGADEAAEHRRPAWSVEGFLGTVYNLPTNLHIRQDGQPDIDAVGRYETRPLEAPVYYAFRVGRWEGQRAWEGELVHHKLYLTNPPAEVGDFSISHGFNLLMVNRAWMRQRTAFRAGAGIVVAHPENAVRGRVLDESAGPLGGGYHLSGPVVQGAVGRRFTLGRGVYVALEGKVTLAQARVPVAGGGATVANAALHVLAGIGYRQGD